MGILDRFKGGKQKQNVQNKKVATFENSDNNQITGNNFGNQEINNYYPAVPNSLQKKYKSNITISENENFTGRVEILKDLRLALTTECSATLTQVIQGLGGVGKTQIAIEYTYRFYDKYDYIWWMNAENTVDIAGEYRKFAIMQGLIPEDIRDIDTIINLVKDWLSRNSKWLFIFDNAEDSASIKKYLPFKNDGGNIIVTTRNGNWNGLGKLIPIDLFSPSEAEKFIMKRAPRTKKDGAYELAEELGYLPLTLEQACAYIIINKISYLEYLAIYKSSKIELFVDEDVKPSEYSYSVATTWQVSISKIKNEATKQLLNMFAFLAPDDIRLDMFVRGKEYLPDTVKMAFSNEVQINKMLSELKKYSLIKEDSYESELGTNHPDTGASLNSLAALYYSQGKHKEAEPLYKRAVEILHKALGSKHITTQTAVNNFAVFSKEQARYKRSKGV